MIADKDASRRSPISLLEAIQGYSSQDIVLDISPANSRVEQLPQNSQLGNEGTTPECQPKNMDNDVIVTGKELTVLLSIIKI